MEYFYDIMYLVICDPVLVIIIIIIIEHCLYCKSQNFMELAASNSSTVDRSQMYCEK